MNSRLRGSNSLTKKPNFDIHKPKQTIEKYGFHVTLSKVKALKKARFFATLRMTFFLFLDFFNSPENK